MAIEVEAIATTEEERNESGSEEPAPKKKSKFMSLLEDVWEPEVSVPGRQARRKLRSTCALTQKPLLLCLSSKPCQFW